MTLTLLIAIRGGPYMTPFFPVGMHNPALTIQSLLLFFCHLCHQAQLF